MTANASPQYAELKDPLPMIYTPDHYKDWDAAMRQLAIANAVISKCEKVQMPVSEERLTCDALCSHFNRLNAEFRGPQAANPIPLTS